MLVSITEPKSFPGTRSSVPERYGVDFFMVSRRGEKVGVQRKEVNDLVASFFDGRLDKELGQMQQLDRAALLVEGRFGWTNEGNLLGYRGRSFTRDMYHSLIFHIQLQGIWFLVSEDKTMSGVMLDHIERWVQKEKHKGLSRPGPKASEWGVVGSREWGVHMLQSFPGIGRELAERIYDHFGRVPLKWDVDSKAMEQVDGLGKGKVTKLWRAFDGKAD